MKNRFVAARPTAASATRVSSGLIACRRALAAVSLIAPDRHQGCEPQRCQR